MANTNTYHSPKLRLDIGGPKGNAFYILSLVDTLGKHLGMTSEERNAIKDKMSGKVAAAVGFKHDYNNLIREFSKAFPFVELYADRKLNSIDSDLYEIKSNEVIEL